MTPLPITLCFFTSTKGHYGRRTDWRLTLDHLDRQLPLSLFGGRICSLKITPGDEALAATMQSELEARGFKVLTATADWSRGASHQAAYMDDVCRISRDPLVHAHPYVWWVEDDGLCLSHAYPLERLLGESAHMLAADSNLLTVRLRRRDDDRGPTVADEARTDPRFFYSQHFNFQPGILRSRDFQLVAMQIERNPGAAASIQCEMLWRMVLAQFTRSLMCHAVWECDHAETIHIGIPQAEHEAAIRKYLS